MKFTKNTIELCGKEFKFKKCTNQQILEHQKAIEKYQEQFNPISEKANKIERDVKDIDTQIKAIENYTKAVENKSEATDEEWNKVAEFGLELIELNREKRKLIEKAEKLDKKHTKDLQNLHEYVLEQYGHLASLQLEGLTKEFYVENADASDTTIVRLLGSIKKMLALGASSKDVEKFVKANMKEEAEQTFRNKRRN